MYICIYIHIFFGFDWLLLAFSGFGATIVGFFKSTSHACAPFVGVSRWWQGLRSITLAHYLWITFENKLFVLYFGMILQLCWWECDGPIWAGFRSEGVGRAEEILPVGFVWTWKGQDRTCWAVVVKCAFLLYTATTFASSRTLGYALRFPWYFRGCTCCREFLVGVAEIWNSFRCRPSLLSFIDLLSKIVLILYACSFDSFIELLSKIVLIRYAGSFDRIVFAWSILW